MMLERVISGGQTGADQAGWRAAKALGIPTGGWMPKGFLTEDGRHPEFAELYGVEENDSPDYPQRTRDNVLDCGICLWFGDPKSRGGKLTLKTTAAIGRPNLVIESPKGFWSEHDAARWIKGTFRALATLPRGGPGRDGVILVAGNRESSAPGIGAWVEEYLTEVFRILKETP